MTEPENTPSPCRSCGKQRFRLQTRCPQCKTTYYCDKACRKTDRKVHKNYCSMLKSADITGTVPMDSSVSSMLEKYQGQQHRNPANIFFNCVWQDTEDIIKMEYIHNEGILYRGNKHEKLNKLLTEVLEWRLLHVYLLEAIGAVMDESDYLVITCGYVPEEMNKAARFPIVGVDIVSRSELFEEAEDAITNISQHIRDLVKEKRHESGMSVRPMLIRINLEKVGLPDLTLVNTYCVNEEGRGSEAKRDCLLGILAANVREGRIMTMYGDMIAWEQGINVHA